MSTSAGDGEALPLERATGLSPHLYTSPEVYRLEEEVIFRRSWNAIGRVDQVAKPGDYFRFDLAGTPLIAVRGQDDTVRVLSGSCLHRYMPVVEGEGNRTSFQCPYHLWTYGLDGQLIGAPEMEQAEGFSMDKCRLPEARMEIWEGFIFVNLQPDAEPLGPQLTTVSEKMRQYRVGEMRTVAIMDYDSDWNWKIMVENFIESYHHIGIHRETLEPIFPARHTTHDDTDGPYVYHHIPTKERFALPTQFDVPDDLTEEQRTELLVVNIFPFCLFALQPDELNYLQVIPESTERHRVRWYVCVPESALDDPELDSKVANAKQTLDSIHREDMAACRAVQQGVASSFAAPGRLSHLEKGVWQFNNWVREQLAGAS